MGKTETLAEGLPAIVARQKIGEYLGGLYSARYLANLNSRGLGPRPMRIGRKVVYTKEELLRWLQELGANSEALGLK